MDEHEAKAALEAAGWEDEGLASSYGATSHCAAAYRPLSDDRVEREVRFFVRRSPDQARALLVASVQQTARAEKLEAVVDRAVTLLGKLTANDERYEAVALIRTALTILKEVSNG